MAHNVDFERKLLELNDEFPGEFTLFLQGAIQMYLEFVNVHDHTEEAARFEACAEMIDGTRAMVELYDEGML